MKPPAFRRPIPESLSARIGWGYALILGALLAVMALVWIAFGVAQHGSRIVRDEAVPGILASRNMVVALEQMENAEYLYFGSPEVRRNGLAEFNDHAAEFEAVLAEAEPLARTPAMKGMLDEIQRHYGVYMHVDRTIRAALAQGRVYEAGRLNFTASREQADTIRRLTRAFSNASTEEILRAQAIQQKTLDRIERVALLIAAFAVACAGVLWVRASKAILSPLRALQRATARVAEGDFTPLAPHGKAAETTEMAALWRDFDHMTQRLDVMSAALQRTNADLEAEVSARTAELRAAMGELEKLVAELRGLDAMKSNFMATVSHELLTPINFITGYGSALEDGLLGELGERQAHAVGQMLQGADRLTRLVRNVLEYTQMESGRLALVPEATPLTPVLATSVEAVRGRAEAKSQQLDLAIAPALPPAWADPDRIAQILAELLDNAVKFTAEGGHVRVHAYAQAEALVVDVCDTGVGLSGEECEQLFRGFFQADAGLTRSHGGLGLGLALSHHLATHMGGTLSVRSQLAKGSTFRLTLPRSAAGEVGPRAPATETALGEPGVSRLAKPA